MDQLNLEANRDTVAEVLVMTRQSSADDLAPMLRNYAQVMVVSEYPAAQLYADLMNAHALMAEHGASEAQEDAFLDVMDYLTGWCAPNARIY